MEYGTAVTAPTPPRQPRPNTLSRGVYRLGSVVGYYVVWYPLLLILVAAALASGFLGGLYLQWYALRLAQNLWLVWLVAPYSLAGWALVRLLRRASAPASALGLTRLLLSFALIISLVTPAALFLSRRINAEPAVFSMLGTLFISSSAALWAFILESDWLEPQSWLSSTSSRDLEAGAPR
ncbi:hypothetical protein CDCA_CDCA03G1061 [Cyanidium caldarium]|uniref:Uncharacterized protein n=1 Tax=Cyanidium caldarium TaxID=2771 RepID=A0AAV9ISG9_CYACA|nr:hypothetical protein CDCA_CDCA03G1061 [Cyanidium caldarium]